MKRLLAVLALLLPSVVLGTSPTPGGSLGVAVSSNGAHQFLQVDSLNNLIPSILAVGYGFASPIPAPAGSVAIAVDPSGHYQFLQVDSTGALITNVTNNSPVLASLASPAPSAGATAVGDTGANAGKWVVGTTNSPIIASAVIGQTGLIGIPNLLTIGRNIVNPASNDNCAYILCWPSFTTPGTLTVNTFATRTENRVIIATGTQLGPFASLPGAQSGESNAVWSVALRNYNGAADDDGGKLTNQYAFRGEYGHFSSNAAATPQTLNSVGLFLRPFCYTGTITNLYDLYIANDREPFAGTVTNHYGFYSPSTTAQHYMAGNLFLGLTPATSAWKLSVLGETMFGNTAANAFYTQGSSINGQYGTNANGSMWLNFAGYNGGTTQFRDTKIGDGKNAAVVTCTGSTKGVAFAGAITTTGITMGSGTGTVTAASGVFSVTSDKRAKNPHGDFTTGLDAIRQLHPVTYDFKADPKHLTRAGFYTQDVEPLIPNAVFHDSPDGMASLDDRPILAAIVNAVKELDQRSQADWFARGLAGLALAMATAAYFRKRS